jgi:hypothetical protein
MRSQVLRAMGAGAVLVVSVASLAAFGTGTAGAATRKTVTASFSFTTKNNTATSTATCPGAGQGTQHITFTAGKDVRTTAVQCKTSTNFTASITDKTGGEMAVSGAFNTTGSKITFGTSVRFVVVFTTTGSVFTTCSIGIGRTLKLKYTVVTHEYSNSGIALTSPVVTRISGSHTKCTATLKSEILDGKFSAFLTVS